MQHDLQVYEPIDPEVPASLIPEMVRRPEDGLENVKAEIKCYMTNVLPVLEEYIVSHDRQQVIELNGLLDKQSLLNTLMNKLATYCAYCAIQPIPLYLDDEDQDAEIEADELIKMLVKRVRCFFSFFWPTFLAHWCKNYIVWKYKKNDWYDWLFNPTIVIQEVIMIHSD